MSYYETFEDRDVPDIPIKPIDTFGHELRSPLGSPTHGKIADIDVDQLFARDEMILDEVDPLSALTILHYLVKLLIIRSQKEDGGSNDDNSVPTELPSPPLGPEEIEQDCPLSPRRAPVAPSPEENQAQYLENTPDYNELNKTPNSKIMQNKILTKRFSLKSSPPVTITEYLDRINQYCGLSTAVYLTTSLYLYRLVHTLEILELNELNVHRILIAALRVSCKTIEDLHHKQTFVAKIGGVDNKDLLSLEISFLFLLKFQCQASEGLLTTFLGDMKKLHESN